MTTFLNVISWIFCFIFLFIALVLPGMGGRIQFFLALGIALILLPPFRTFINNTDNITIKWWGYLIIASVLWVGIMLGFILNPAKSIYRTEKYKEQLISIYDNKLSQWPVPYETTLIETKYGKIHVIISGPEEGYPVLLINASSLSGWSWLYNVGELNKKYRTYAIDNIGEGGKNEMIAPGKIPKTGQEIADLYTEITNKLGIENSHVVGASIGGFISTNYAIYAPERVDKLVLLGSMGYGFTIKTVILMMLAQSFPARPVQTVTFKWAFGDKPELNEYFGEWFRLYMRGLIPTPVRPLNLKAEELKKIQSPTLAYFGTKDGVVGNAEKTKKLAQNIPNARIEIVESGHLIGAELSETVNTAIIDFFEDK